LLAAVIGLFALSPVAPAATADTCAGAVLCALNGCNGTVNICPTGADCTGTVDICPYTDPADCHGVVDVCAGGTLPSIHFCIPVVYECDRRA
jgi:hypothetical protein